MDKEKDTEENNIFYRYRGIDNLLKHKELENQEIYFAPASELNDPLEHYVNLFFNGDKIVIHNLFEHYLMVLFFVVVDFNIRLPKEFTFDNQKDFLLECGEFNSSPYLKPLFENIKNDFFKVIDNNIINNLENALISNDLLVFLLRIIQLFSYLLIQKHVNKNFYTFNLDLVTSNTLDILNKAVNQIKDKKQYSKDEIGTYKTYQNHAFLHYFDIENVAPINLIQNFPVWYVNSLENLVQPNLGIACFTKDSKNSFMWSIYAQKHQGVCLIFEADEKKSLSIQNLNKGSYSPFYEIYYDTTHKPLNFFTGLLELYGYETSKKNPIYFWFVDKKTSKKSVEYKNFIDKKRKIFPTYILLQDYLIKTKDWKFEKEYRMLLNGNNNRASYDFKCLKGIIFGINISSRNRNNIIKILEKKCKENNITDFKYYQAYYNQFTNEIDHYLIENIKQFLFINNDINKEENK